MRPLPGGGLTRAQCSLDSPYGRIEVAWHRADRGVELDLTVPGGTVADIELPDGSRHEAGPGRHQWTGALV